jgi:probable rRNA maturation factor
MESSISAFASKKKYAREAALIGKIGRKLPRLLKKSGVGFEIHLISNPEMKALNRRFRTKNRATNILSFNAEAGSARPDLKKNTRYLGEIFLAPDYIRAKKENIDFLLVHGFLHLLGYTHDSGRDRIKMERVEEKLCKKLKIRFIYV